MWRLIALCASMSLALSLGRDAHAENMLYQRHQALGKETIGAVRNPFFCELPAGIRAFATPEQSPLESFETFKKNGYELMKLDAFEMTGLVLSKRTYLADERADISPLDLAIGWMRMSDPSVLSNIEIAQNNRFYYWHVDEYPIPKKELESTSTNLHIIPDNEDIHHNLMSISKGDVITIKGYLVDVKDKDGFLWATSRSRDDIGDGACEIMLVNEVYVVQ